MLKNRETEAEIRVWNSKKQIGHNWGLGGRPGRQSRSPGARRLPSLVRRPPGPNLGLFLKRCDLFPIVWTCGHLRSVPMTLKWCCNNSETPFTSINRIRNYHSKHTNTTHMSYIAHIFISFPIFFLALAPHFEVIRQIQYWSAPILS